MFKKKEENKKYSEESSLLVKFLDLQTDEFITKFIRERYKKGDYVDQSIAASAGGLRVPILGDKVEICRSEIYGYTKIFIGHAKVWDNQTNSKFQGKSRLAKIVK